MPQALARRLGPFPVWAYLVAVAAASLYWQRLHAGGFIFARFGETDAAPVGLSVRVGGADPDEPDAERLGDPFSELGRETQPEAITASGAEGSFVESSGSPTSGGGGGGVYVPPPNPYGIVSPRFPPI